VLIENNIIWCHPGGEKNIVPNGGTGGGSIPPSRLKAKVQVKGTYTADGPENFHIARPSTFVGPLTADADAGKGPGSGFQLKGKGQNGADFARISSSMAARGGVILPSARR
jgi:hypothetical protein